MSRPARRARARTAGLRPAGALALLGLALGSCLVTENNDLSAPRELPDVRTLSPKLVDRVKFAADVDCMPNGMKFEASIRYQDTKSLLFLKLFVNGSDGPFQMLSPGDPPSELRVPNGPLCVPRSQLVKPCNVVQLFVSSNAEKVLPPTGNFDPEVASVQWLLLPASEDQADAEFSDCYQLMNPDGGV